MVSVAAGVCTAVAVFLTYPLVTTTTDNNKVKDKKSTASPQVGGAVDDDDDDDEGATIDVSDDPTTFITGSERHKPPGQRVMTPEAADRLRAVTRVALVYNPNCPACHEIMPEYEAAARELKRRAGSADRPAIFMGTVNTTDPGAEVFLRDHEVSFVPHVIGATGVCNGPGDVRVFQGQARTKANLVKFARSI
jgi:thiol-disulfide isomerase/thioredoxin